tara:strand:+ start:342 stop:1070 length:729 start_codon:yes stop_codon:yes gene_type:complete
MYIFYFLYLLFILYSFYLLLNSPKIENFVTKNKISSKLLNLEKNVNNIKKYIYLQNNLFLKHFKLKKNNINNYRNTHKNSNKNSHKINIDNDKAIEEENNEEKTKMEMQNAVSDIKNDILKKMYEKKDKSIPNTYSKSGLINKNVRYNRQKKMQLKDNCKIVTEEEEYCPDGYTKKEKINKKGISETKCCPKGFKIKIVGSGKGVNKISNKLNEISSKATPESEKEWKKTMKKINFPSGLFL